MKGQELLACLRDELSASTNSELAKKLGVTAGRISQVKSSTEVSSKYAAGLISKIAAARSAEIIKSAIRPIVEFFPIEKLLSPQEAQYVPFDQTSDHGRALRHALEGQASARVHGIYSFYNSQGEIIYLGKTEKQSLYKEISNAYNREMRGNSIYRVRHPWGRYKPKTGSAIRQIQRENVYLYQIADYFSAYEIATGLIGAAESLLIRMVPNDLVNVRIEKKALAVLPPAQL